MLKIIFLLNTTLLAQCKIPESKVQEIQSFIKNDNLYKADKELTKLLRKCPTWGIGWDLLANIDFMRYEKANYFVFSNQFMMSEPKKDGNSTDNSEDSIKRSLIPIIINASPSIVAYQNFMYRVRKATLLSNEAYNSSSYIRMRNIPELVQFQKSKSAAKQFDTAALAMHNENYTSAINYFKKALLSDDSFYTVYMGLAQAYCLSHDTISACKTLEIVKSMFPKEFKPQMQLVELYEKTESINKVLETAIDAVSVYPDLLIMKKIEFWINAANKKLDIEWTPRLVFPNTIVANLIMSEMEMVDRNEEFDIRGCWKFYRKAKDLISPFCNDYGKIVKSNSLTQSKYLEVFSWEEMLKKSTDPKLNQARKMQQMNFLDCYVLLTCFHFDIYDQYEDFVANNKEKISEYFRTFIVDK